MKCFSRIVNGWIQSTILTKSSILDASLGCEYVSDYPEAFLLLLIKASTLNLPLISQEPPPWKFDRVLNTSWVWNCFYVDLVNRISSERKVKRNLGTSNRWPHIVPNRRFEGPLGDVLRTSWGRPESTFQGRPLEARLRCPQDVILERPKDTESGRLRDGHIGSSGGVLGTNICRLSM